MDANTLFITATREQYRFPSSSGQLSVEDLWELELRGKGTKNLDDVAKTLHKSLKEADGEISFVTPAVKTTTELETKLEIVKYVISVKVAEQDARDAAQERSAKKQKLLGLLSKKEDQSLEALSSEELKAMINEL